MPSTRRGLLVGCSAAGTPVAISDHAAAPRPTVAPPGSVGIDPAPLFPLSPLLHMQFMEPLGATDTGVEAAWDHDADDWRRDFVEAVRDLAPKAIRWGGLMSRYYKWREGVGPAAARPPMRNHVWGGWETNRVGTAEFVGLCRSAGAEPLLCVNFQGDGHRRYARTRGGDRTGTAAEAADWVSYCNDPDSAERRRTARPRRTESVFGRSATRPPTTRAASPSRRRSRTPSTSPGRCARATLPSNSSAGATTARGGGVPLWATDMLRRAGEHLDYIAIHMMQQLPIRRDTVLQGARYQGDPARAWDELMEMSGRIGRGWTRSRPPSPRRGPTRIAVTEGHLSLAPHNANPILMEWLTGVYHARALNTYQRHGARVAMATAADFNGTRWTVVAVRLQVPRGVSYLDTCRLGNALVRTAHRRACGGHPRGAFRPGHRREPYRKQDFSARRLHAVPRFGAGDLPGRGLKDRRRQGVRDSPRRCAAGGEPGRAARLRAQGACPGGGAAAAGVAFPPGLGQCRGTRPRVS